MQMPDSVSEIAGMDAARSAAAIPTPLPFNADDAVPGQPGTERTRTVPYGALAEERARRKGLQRELQEAHEARVLLQGRLDVLHELAQQQGRPQTVHRVEGAPGDQDPDSATGGAQPEPVRGIDAIGNDAFRTQVLQSVRSYARERPDFLAAYQHAREARVAELSALGYGAEEALAITFDDELEVIRNAYATGRNPAQVIYDYAIQRGYQAGQAGGEPPARGQTPLHRPVSGGMSEADKVALAARGQAGSKSLSSTGGGSVGTLTLEALAGLSDEEFAEATRGDRWQKLLRG